MTGRRTGLLLIWLMCLMVPAATLADPGTDALREAGVQLTVSGTREGTASAEAVSARGSTAPGEQPEVPAEAEWPESVDEEGYLAEGEFVYEGPDTGLWRYLSSSLRVEIIRRSTDEPRNLVWYEAEVWARGETWGNAPAVPGKHFSTSRWPYLVTS